MVPKEKLIYNELIWHFMYSYFKIVFGVTYRQKLKHSLLGAPRKMVLLKFENKEKLVILMKAFCKLDYYVFIYYSKWSSL